MANTLDWGVELLEAKRKSAQAEQDPHEYSELCSLLGIEDIEDPYLLEKEEAEKKYQEEMSERTCENQRCKIATKFFEQGRCLSKSFEDDIDSKLKLIERYYPGTYRGIKNTSSLTNKGKAFHELMKFAEAHYK